MGQGLARVWAMKVEDSNATIHIAGADQTATLSTNLTVRDRGIHCSQ